MLGSCPVRNLRERLANLKFSQVVFGFFGLSEDWIRTELLGGAAGEQQLPSRDFRAKVGEEGVLGHRERT